MTNPYRTPTITSLTLEDQRWCVPRYRFVIWLLAYLYPVWLTLSFYITWLLAWIQLGHRPRPMLDDPKFIGGLMDIGNLVPGLLLMAMPILAPIGLAAPLCCPVRHPTRPRFAVNSTLAVLYVALCASALFTLRADPGGVVEWWFD